MRPRMLSVIPALSLLLAAGAGVAWSFSYRAARGEPLTWLDVRLVPVPYAALLLAVMLPPAVLSWRGRRKQRRGVGAHQGP